jgi:hypothetical protein
MRPSNKSRSRNKSGGGGNGHNQRRPVGNIVNRVFDSAGPDGKVRGTPQQIIDKYNVLAHDAQLSGDRVTAESYLQHAEHYSRMLGEAQRQQQEQQRQQQEMQQQRDENSNNNNNNQNYRGPRREDQDARDPQGGHADLGGSSGLTMIDPMDTDDAGPVDTPENRAQVPAAVPPQPAPQSTPAEPVGELPQPSEAASGEAPPPKRSRTRRKPRTEKSADAPPAPVE